MKSALLATTAATPLSSGTTTVSESGGFVTYVVSQSGTYTITADGAQGGSARDGLGHDVAGGQGAQVVGTFALTAGETLRIAVGQAGANAAVTASGLSSSSYGGGGGGGGTWVQLINGGSTTLLEVAGGGGGSAYNGPGAADMGGSGTAGSSGSGAGGKLGSYSVPYGGGGGGAKSSGDGYDSTSAGKGGAGLAQGLKGGTSPTSNYGRSGAGGFGGGGGGGRYGYGNADGGGGGGYTGGNASGPNQRAGYGGTSFVAAGASGAVETAGLQSGNGLLTITETPCFASGTQIETESGPVAVEHLREGDYVRLARENAFVPVVWLGHRTVDCARHPRPDAVQPVRVHAGAFGPGLPTRDLILSPDHAVYADGALIPIRHLLNGATIVREARAAVTYWHVELERHDVLLAEGLPCESYLDTGNRAAFANAGPVVSAHPHFDPVHAMDVWATEACAPLVTSGIDRDAVHDLSLALAADLGHRITIDPDLTLLVDGRSVAPVRVGDLLRFELPAGSHVVRLRSRTFVPSETSATARDNRILGVAIIALLVDGAAVDPTALDAADGWSIAEMDGATTWRWTDGDALLRCHGARVVEIATGPAGRYWDASDAASPGAATRAA